MGKSYKSYIKGDVLKSLGFQNYADYLRSDHWRDLKRRYFKSKLLKRTPLGAACCVLCGDWGSKGPLELHHKTYKRLGREWLNDLILVCGDCHELAHAAHRLKPQFGLFSATNRLKTEQGRRKLRKRLGQLGSSH